MRDEHRKKPLTLEEWKKIYLFPSWARFLIALAGLIFLLVSLATYSIPTQREAREQQSGKEFYVKTTTTDSDPTSVTMGLFAVGVAFIVWGIIGLRYPKFEAFGVSTELPPLPDDLDNISPTDRKRLEPPPAVDAPAAAPVPAVAPQAMAIHGQVGDNPIHTFLLRSSWNGLLILKACQSAKDKQKTLSLREVCALSGMSYDYAFGYFIASFSADVIAGIADATTGITRVLDVHPVLRERIDEIINGNLVVSPMLEARKRTDLANLADYLAKL